MIANTYARELFNDVMTLMNEVKDLYIQELTAQGHNNTGNLMRSAETSVTFEGLSVKGKLLLAGYFEFLERRLPPSQVPYRRGSGRKKSKVVQALFKYFQQRGVRDFKGATFGTLNKWKSENGRPTRASRRFSSNGRRLRPLGVVLDRLDKKVEELLQTRAARGLEAVLNNIAESTQRKIV